MHLYENGICNRNCDVLWGASAVAGLLQRRGWAEPAVSEKPQKIPSAWMRWSIWVGIRGSSGSAGGEHLALKAWGKAKGSGVPRECLRSRLVMVKFAGSVVIHHLPRGESEGQEAGMWEIRIKKRERQKSGRAARGRKGWETGVWGSQDGSGYEGRRSPASDFWWILRVQILWGNIRSNLRSLDNTPNYTGLKEKWSLIPTTIILLNVKKKMCFSVSQLNSVVEPAGEVWDAAPPRAGV